MLLKEVQTTRRRRTLLDEPDHPASSATAQATTAAGEGLSPLAAADDPFRLPIPGLDDDDNKPAASSEYPSSPHPPPLPLVRPPYASAALAALVEEYAGCVGRGAWGQARTCLERLPTEGDERPWALLEMAGALLGSLPARGWRLSVEGQGQQLGQAQMQRRLRVVGHGGASAAPETLEAEVLGPLRAAVLATAWADEEYVYKEQQQQQPGAPLLLALRLEAAAPESAGAWAPHAAARLVTSRPGLESLHCCGLALRLAGPQESAYTTTPGLAAGATPGLLDCMLGILALSFPGATEVEATMAGLAAAASSAPLPPWEVEEEEEAAYRILPPALATRLSVTPALLLPDAAEGEAAAVAALAEALWAEVQGQYHDPNQQQPHDQTASSALSLRTRQLQRLQQQQQQQRLHGGQRGRFSFSLPLLPLPIALLERLRARWAGARKAPRGVATPDGRLLARALLGLLRRCYAPPASGKCTETEAEGAVGHVLPLAFVLVEEYDKEELQLLGFLAWAHALAAAGAGAPAFGRQLRAHLGIQMTVLSRCLKVAARKPRVLRPLLYCAAALLRIARLHSPPPSASVGSSSSSSSSPHGPDQDQRREELDRWRRSLLEALLHAVPRFAYFIPHGVTDPRAIAEERALGFVLLEGIARFVRDFEEGGGCDLVRYLRPLTQVLAMQPLEEGGAADRILALRTLLRVLGQCRPMAHQLVHETLAQVLRVYLGIIARQQQQEEQGMDKKHDAAVLRLCRRVGAALAGACAERAARRGANRGPDPLRTWVASIEAKGVPELKGFWDGDDGNDGAMGPV